MTETTAASLFDPNTFLDTETNDPLSTQPSLIPLGKYTSIVKDVKGRKVTTDKGVLVFLDVVHSIDCNQQIPDGSGRTIKDVLSRDEVQTTDSVVIDLTVAGTIDARPGMNYRIGRYREALGQNVPGVNWKPRMLVGQPLSIEIGHRPDKNDASVMYVQVKGVSPLGS